MLYALLTGLVILILFHATHGILGRLGKRLSWQATEHLHDFLVIAVIGGPLSALFIGVLGAIAYDIVAGLIGWPKLGGHNYAIFGIVAAVYVVILGWLGIEFWRDRPQNK